MAKKHKVFKIPPLFKSDRDLLSIANDPKKFAALRDVIDKAAGISEKFKQCKTLSEWLSVVVGLLPEFEKKSEFVQKLETLAYEYNNESENSKPA